MEQPKCDACGFAVGWTRYIRCVHFGLPVLCWACDFKALQERARRGARVHRGRRIKTHDLPLVF